MAIIQTKIVAAYSLSLYFAYLWTKIVGKMVSEKLYKNPARDL